MNLTIEGLKFSYPGHPVLKGVDLKLEESEIMCIVGPNGCGKSTLVKCIEGLLHSSKGRILLGDVDNRTMDAKKIARIIGYVPQTTHQLFSSTVFDTVLMGRKPYSSWKSSEKDIDIVIDILTTMGLEKIAMEEFNHLSGGQKQRVLIARALAQKPKILLLDEPTSALDIAHQFEVMEIIHDIVHKQQIEVLMIVHDLNLASRYADKVVMMYEGCVYASGKVEDVFTKDNIANVYGVEASISHYDGKLSVTPIKLIEKISKFDVC
jgi:iron complex transport system ATP-binding protein